MLHLGAEGFGLLMASLGVGAVTGALAVGAWRAPPAARPAVRGGRARVGGLLALFAARAFWIAAAALFLTGLFGLMLVASCNTRMQLAAPDELRGRVMSLYTLCGAASSRSAPSSWARLRALGVGRALLVNGTAGLLGVALLLGWWSLSGKRAGTGRLSE